MRVVIAAVAEHAWVENNCLSICRTFDTVNAEKFPYILPRFSIALRLLIKRAEAGPHVLRILLADSDGKKMMDAEVNINVSIPEESVFESAFAFALNGQMVSFPKPGEYTVDIFIDGRVEASLPVYLKEKKKR